MNLLVELFDLMKLYNQDPRWGSRASTGSGAPSGTKLIFDREWRMGFEGKVDGEVDAS